MEFARTGVRRSLTQAPTLLCPIASRRCCPCRGSRTDTDGHPEALHETAARSTPRSGERSRSGGEFVVFSSLITNTQRVRKEGQPTLFRIRLSPGTSAVHYFPTVRGETWIPSFSFNSLAMRSSSHEGFSIATFHISSRRSLAKRGLPVVLDFQRQKSRNPLRCQRSTVSGFTFTSASRHWNIQLRLAIIHLVESSARRGLTFRSWKSASCLR
jgi:hypothetical protein